MRVRLMRIVAAIGAVLVMWLPCYGQQAPAVSISVLQFEDMGPSVELERVRWGGLLSIGEAAEKRLAAIEGRAPTDPRGPAVPSLR